MKKKKLEQLLILSFATTGILCQPIYTMAQTYSTSSNLTALPFTDRTVSFKVSEKGITRDVKWGGDLAWFDENNLRRCVLFMGKDNVEVVRTSFQPTYPLVDGDLQQQQKDTLQARIHMLRWANPDIELFLNCDDPHMSPWFVDPVEGANAERWAQLIDVAMKYYQEAGYNVVSVAPFNEPDNLLSSQGSKDTQKRQQEFYDIAAKLKENPRFDNIRISGGNTLNTDCAMAWYDKLKPVVDEGNTHQLAGNFMNYANFFTTVRADGKHATNDEMHNVMEAMVGLEYGLQTGIWWGTADYARGEFCKASHGERLAYAEHRDNWSAASVYRAPDGKIQAFGGTSERQAVTTTYRFFSKERDVYFDGHGPQREFLLELPGGNGYQNGQSNAERCINITWGEDIRPVIDGTYSLINKSNNRVLDVVNNNVVTDYYSSTRKEQQWNVSPVDSRIGGDFSYVQILTANGNQTLDILNWSLEDKADIILYNNLKTANEQWYLEYAGDGWFYIRSRYSAQCLALVNGEVVQRTQDKTDNTQLWRFIPKGVRPRIQDIDAPNNLKATGQNASVMLTWETPQVNSATYSILRSEDEDGTYDLIARNVEGTSFIDHKTEEGVIYYYKVKTTDPSLNTSQATPAVKASSNGEKGLVALYDFEQMLKDTTCNINHGVSLSSTVYTEGKTGNYALELDGTDNFIQLPTHVGQHNEMTIATWIYYTRRGDTGQYIFNFGNGEDEYMGLTPRSSNNMMRLIFKSGEIEQHIDGVSLTAYRNKWVHLAVTISKDSVCLYINGEQIATSKDITIRPSDLKPVLNYIGRGQSASDPLFNGDIDDFRIYNYALSSEVLKSIVDQATSLQETASDKDHGLNLPQNPVDRELIVSYKSNDNGKTVRFSLHDLTGKSILETTGKTNETAIIDISAQPEGLYILKAEDGSSQDSRKVIIRH